ncbi:hypothetical protein A9Q74_13065 [Colwellia sp. 39_35_sub15_T18]|nr:hypothetical protein A9Q74_13065 [Colwellia sp. 39_35_sub15_T18]
MIIEFLPTFKSDARGRVAAVIEYIFDTSKSDDNKNSDNVKFIGASDSLCAPDPFHSFLDKSGKHIQPDLTYLIEKFDAIEQKNRRVKKPFMHIVLSLRAGEKLTNSQWHSLITDYVKMMGYTHHHWVASNHSNTAQNHAHLLLSCIGNTPPYKKQTDSQNFEKSALIRHELEQKYSLQADNNPFIGDVCNKINNATYKTKLQLIRNAIDHVIPTSNNKNFEMPLPIFIDKLNKQGIGCYVQLKQGEAVGLSFSLGGESYRASKLGKGYKWGNLQSRKVFYDKSLHWQDIEQLNSQEKKLTALINNGFQSNKLTDEMPNQHYLLIPNNAVSKYPMNKRLHRYKMLNFWFPVQTQGRTKQQIESDIMQMRTLRILLEAYFSWLNRRNPDKKEKEHFELGKLNAGISECSYVNGSHSKVNALVKHPKNHKILSEHGCLLVSKDKLQSSTKKANNLTPPASQEISIF